jgi:E3 ubiquitin-protein ligase HUWE1
LKLIHFPPLLRINEDISEIEEGGLSGQLPRSPFQPLQLVSDQVRRRLQHPQVAELVTKLVNTQSDDLADVLADIDSWKWPRSDLNAWTKVLDKFDAILEEVIRDYDVDKLQINVFTPATKKTICHILRFERLLLENSTNRKTFNSYDVRVFPHH